jgi:hypothetical protein
MFWSRCARVSAVIFALLVIALGNGLMGYYYNHAATHPYEGCPQYTCTFEVLNTYFGGRHPDMYGYNAVVTIANQTSSCIMSLCNCPTSWNRSCTYCYGCNYCPTNGSKCSTLSRNTLSYYLYDTPCYAPIACYSQHNFNVETGLFIALFVFNIMAVLTLVTLCVYFANGCKNTSVEEQSLVH